MRTLRPGCLSGTGMLTVLVTLLLITGLGLARGGVMFSPGDLNAQPGEEILGGVASHAETGGRCSACHTAIWERQVMADRCLVCHTELLRDLQDFHGAMLAQGQQVSCLHCHTDHGGAQASLTLLDIDAFPHGDAAGYSLEGHRKLADGSAFSCADCHGSEITRFDLAVCESCHRELDRAYLQAHSTAFGSACLDCHDGKDTYGRVFNHSLTAFPLEGEHNQTGCEACHAGARTQADLQSTPQDCFACHSADDPHDGRFGQDCAACHSPQDWEEAAFDHSQTDFPLTGGHRQVSCSDCHVGGVYAGTPQDCFACHSGDDAHNGQFGTDCAACHSPEDWENASFDHSLSNFPLTGAHESVECAQCHINNVFAGTPTQCADCHVDPEFHRGQFGLACADCHNTSAWAPARYELAHQFPLNHGEGASSCRVCHPSALSQYTCYGCHEHTEANIASKHREEGISDFQNCMRCHPTGREDEAEGDDD